MNHKHLSDILEGNAIDETIDLITEICPDINQGLIRKIDKDLTAIFTGTDNNFKENTLPYHNLRHTQKVVLATARLFHGLHLNNIFLAQEVVFKGLLSAYFHDTGMLLHKKDNALSGSEYIGEHEKRSIKFLKEYVESQDLPKDIASDCGIIIQYTALNSDPKTFKNHSQEIELTGQVLGSADILAQMADRYYLECIPLLHKEMLAGGVNNHDTALELLRQTANFYHEVVLKRLVVTLSDRSDAMRSHFKAKHQLDRNLYTEYIDKNIDYLKKIIGKCNDITCLSKYLKRNPPIT